MAQPLQHQPRLTELALAKCAACQAGCPQDGEVKICTAAIRAAELELSRQARAGGAA